MTLISHLFLWSTVLVLGFLVIGLLAANSRLGWRLEQLEAITPHRLGRSGLKEGGKAPSFSGLTIEGRLATSSEWAGKPFILMFLKTGCQPCEHILPELNRLHQQGVIQVIVLLQGKFQEFQEWWEEKQPGFPVLLQEDETVARRYQIAAVPFAFLVDHNQNILSKGLATRKHHLRFLLASNH